MPLTQVSSRAIEDTLRYVLGASGTNHYTFTGKGLNGAVNDPTIYLVRGQTYIFENRSGGHPFYIKTSIANGGTNDAYNTGVTNNGGGNGTEIVFTVPHDAPDTLYYQCSSHSSMAGEFKIAGSVADGSITESKLADDAVTNAKIASGAVGTNKLASGAVGSGEIAAGSIVNSNINSSAAIAGSKVDPNFAAQDIQTTGIVKGVIVPVTYATGRRNMFINGEFSIAQRGDRDPNANRDNGANNLGYGGPDHVQVVKNTGTYTAKQKNENDSPRTQAGACYSYELHCDSASSTGTTAYTFLNFMWNGHETARLLYGTANARPITISFWVRCSKTGNFGINLRNYSQDRQINTSVTISSADTWEYKSVTFAGDTSDQFSVSINAVMAIEFGLTAGSDYSSGGGQTTWAARNDTKRSNATLGAFSSGDKFGIALLQVEMGQYATPFEFRTYGEYLHDCEYFFQKPHGTNPFALHCWGHKVADTDGIRVQSMMRPTEMRINPTDYHHDNDPSGKHAQRWYLHSADYDNTYNVAMGVGSNKKEFSNGTKYPYGVTGFGRHESGIAWGFDFESSAEY